MEKLCEIKEKAIELLEMGLNQDIKDICSKELYELMDIIKDIEEAMYYHTVRESMEQYPEEYRKKYAPDYNRRMYYTPVDEEKSLEEYIEEMDEMIKTMDVSERSSIKQKLIQFVNKI